MKMKAKQHQTICLLALMLIVTWTTVADSTPVPLGEEDGASTDSMVSVEDLVTDKMVEDSTVGHYIENITSSALNITLENDPEVSEYDAYLYKLSDDLFLYIIPVVTVVGIAGNGMTLVVMNRQSLRLTPVSVYLSALAFADTLVLILDFVNNWIEIITGLELKSEADWFCKFHNFLFNASYTYSAWLVVAVAIERVIVVWFPLLVRTICTTKKSLTVVIALPIILVLIYMNSLWMWEVGSEDRCDVHVDHFEYMVNIFPWLSGTLYSYMPVVVLVLSTILIIVKLVEANKTRKTMGVEKLETMKITVTIVAVCITFLLLTVPLTLFYVILFNLGEFVQRSAGMAMGRTIILILGLSNHAINFFLYVITSEKFRIELRSLFGINKNKPKVKATSSATNTGDTNLSSDAQNSKYELSVSAMSIAEKPEGICEDNPAFEKE